MEKIETQCKRLFKTSKGIYREIKKNPSDIEKYIDFFTCLKEFQNLKKNTEDVADWSCEHSRLEWSPEMAEMHKINNELQVIIRREMRNERNISDLFDLYSRSLHIEAPWNFEQYMLYNEIDRAPEEKFYQPRRKTLKQAVDALQDLEDDILDELFLSQPPRTGKTTLMLMFITWHIGRHPLESNLYSACADTLTKSFYNGILEIMRDPFTYHWDKVFPGSPIVQTNANDETINLLKKNRYPSLTCRSIDGSLNGSCDCTGIQIGDDFCSGIEEAKNKDRLANLWGKVDNNYLTRAKSGSKKIWNGTRWSLFDPIGIRLELLKTDKQFKNVRYKVINIPALDSNDKSNFDYKYGVGFDTAFYKQRRASFEHNGDLASWFAQYQGEPIEREGSLFTSTEMKFCDGKLPDRDPDRRFMAVDPAFGGSDFVASPVCLQYEDDIYIPDVVYTNKDKKVSVPLLADAVGNWGVTSMQIEANKSTESYAEEVIKELKRRGIKYCKVTTKPAPSDVSKSIRIQDKAPDIKDHMIFLDANHRSTAYQKFFENVVGFKIYAKKQHDDAPDSLSMAIDMVFHIGKKVGKIFNRFI